MKIKPVKQKYWFSNSNEQKELKGRNKRKDREKRKKQEKHKAIKREQ